MFDPELEPADRIIAGCVGTGVVSCGWSTSCATEGARPHALDSGLRRKDGLEMGFGLRQNDGLVGPWISPARRNPRTAGQDARGYGSAAQVFQRPCVVLKMLDARRARDHVEPVCVTATVTVTVAEPPLSSLASTVRSTEEPAFELISPATVISPELV